MYKMSSCLNNRLDKLENEIQLLLLIHNNPKKYQHHPKTLLKNRPNNKDSIYVEFRPRSSSLPTLQYPNNDVQNSDVRDKSKGKHTERKSRKVKICNSTGNNVHVQMPLRSSSKTKINKQSCKCTQEDTASNAKGDSSGMIALKKKLAEEEESRTKLEEELNNLKKLNNQLTLTKLEDEKLLRLARKRTLMAHTSQTKLQQLIKEKETLQQTIAVEEEKLLKANAEIKQFKRQLVCANSAAAKYEALLKSMHDKNELVEKLNEEINARNGVYEDLMERYKEMSNNLRMVTENYNRIKNTNEELALNVMSKHKELEEHNSKTGGELKRFKDESIADKKEIKQLQTLCETQQKDLSTNTKEKLQFQTDINKLQCKLIDGRKRESNLTKTIGKLQNKSLDMEKEYNLTKKTLNDKLKNALNENKLLQEKYKRNDGDAEKYNDLYIELNSLKKHMSNREDQILLEKNELKHLIEELTVVIRSQKENINSWVIRCKEQKFVIDSQLINIKKKDEQLKSVGDEADAIKKRYGDLEKHVMVLRNNLNNNVDTNVVSKASLENENCALKKIISEIKDHLNIKDKMLDDQRNSLSDLKKKLDEKQDQVANLYKDLNLEKKSKNELNNKITRMSKEKSSLLNDLRIFQEDFNAQSNLITNLERKLEMHQLEYELQQEVSNKEKQQAFSAAKFATEKLIETMEDFQKHAESHNQVRNALTNLLQDKDDKLRAAILQMSTLTLDPDSLVNEVNHQKKLFVSDRSFNSSTTFASARQETPDNNNYGLTMPAPFDNRSISSHSDLRNAESSYNYLIPYIDSYRSRTILNRGLICKENNC